MLSMKKRESMIIMERLRSFSKGRVTGKNIVAVNTGETFYYYKQEAGTEPFLSCLDFLFYGLDCSPSFF